MAVDLKPPDPAEVAPGKRKGRPPPGGLKGLEEVVEPEHAATPAAAPAAGGAAPAQLEDDEIDPELLYDPMPHKTLEELEQQLGGVRDDNATRKRETLMLEHHLELHNAELAKIEEEDRRARGITAEDDAKANALADADALGGADGPRSQGSQRKGSTRNKSSNRSARSTKRQSSRAGGTETAFHRTLTAAQKAQIANRRLIELGHRFGKETTGLVAELRHRQAQEQSLVLGNRKVDEARGNFQRFVEAQYKQGQSKRDPKDWAQAAPVVWEQYALYRKAEHRQATQMHEKTMLKCNSVRLQIKNCRETLRRQRLADDHVTPTDFEQLKIQAARSRKLMDSLLTSVARHKKGLSAKTHSANALHDQMAAVEVETGRMQKQLKGYHALRQSTDQAMLDEEAATERQTRANQLLRKKLSGFHAPHPLDYVALKADRRELKQVLVQWGRRVAVAEAKMARYRGAWRRLSTTRSAPVYRGLMPGLGSRVTLDLSRHGSNMVPLERYADDGHSGGHSETRRASASMVRLPPI